MPTAAAPRWSIHPALRFVDGAPYSSVQRRTLHRRDGAFDDAHQLFIDGSRLRERWRSQQAYTVLELGFGLGVNFIASLLAWRQDPQRCARFEYIAVEQHPLQRAELRRGLAALTQGSGGDIDLRHDPLAAAVAELCDQWPGLSQGIHRMQFARGAVTLLLVIDDAARCLSNLRLAADSFFLNDLRTGQQPSPWSPAMFKGLAKLARRDASLVSSDSSAPLADGLRANGFELSGCELTISRLPVAIEHTSPTAPIHAIYRPRWHTFAEPLPRPNWLERQAIVIGAGMAGCALTRSLSQRGWQVDLFDGAARIASAASSQPMCAEHPHVSADDNLLARLTRAASGLSRGADSRWPPFEDACRHTGKLLLATTAQDAEQQRQTIRRAALPDDYVQVLDRSQALQQARWPWLHNSPKLAGAIWFPGARSARPLDLCRYWLGRHSAITSVTNSATHLASHANRGVNLHLGQQIARLTQTDHGWQVYDDQHRLLGSAAVVILANADAARRLAPLASMAIRVVAGQTSVYHSSIGVPQASLGGSSYLCPIDDQHFLVGATFEPPEQFQPNAAGDNVNLAGLAETVGMPVPMEHLTLASHHGGSRCATRDRLPAIGAWPDEARALQQRSELLHNGRLSTPQLPGLYTSFAHGARGLLWSVLAAEIVVAQIEGDAMPLSGELLAAIDPSRYVRRWLRQT